MIEPIAQKIITAYDKLPPKQKALADMLGILFGAVIGAILVAIIVSNGLWMELGLGLLAYSIFGMIHLIYKSRVAHYEFQEKYGDK